MAKKTSDYEKVSGKEVIKDFASSGSEGLSSAEVKRRLVKYGENKIEEKEESFAHRVLRRFYGPIPIMIEIAALLSAIVQKWDDFFIIMFLLFANAGIDIWQEGKALSALKVLKSKLAKTSLVLRDGEFKTIRAEEIVSGDIIKLEIGNIVPADAKLLKFDELQIDQSGLTGESLPVKKKIGDIAYGNSIIKKGEAIAIVVNTGIDTYFGNTVSLVAKAERSEKSHLEQAVTKIGKYLIFVTMFLVAVILIVSLLRGQKFLEILRYVLILAIASIPVALPAILSITMAVGALTLSKKRAIISKLSSIEELAGIDTLCFDKTGTLTQNKMSISNPISFGRNKTKDLMIYAGLASSEEEHDPIEVPIFDYLKENKIYEQLRKYKKLKFKPFNPVDKRTEAIVMKGAERFSVMKGAVQVILKLSKTRDSKKIQEKVDEYSKNGMRAIAVAVKKGSEFEFVGIIPLLDLPREDSKEIIKEARGLGLSLKMLTGDNISIAKYISSVVGIGKKIFDASILKKDEVRTVVGKTQNMSIQNPALIRDIDNANGFAQVYPEDKYTIVDSLQKSGHIVGMTGDGVNDAPALKKSDGGIAVSGATDAARASADLILMDKGLSVIIDAIKESRKIFLRMKSYSTYRIAETIRLIFFITASILFFGFYPVTAIMVILLLIFNDLPIMTIAYDNTEIEKNPVRWDLREVLIVSTLIGLAGVVSTFSLLYISKVFFGFGILTVQTIMFLKLAVAGRTTIFVTRTKRRFWQRPFPAPILLYVGIGTEVIATLFAVYGWFIAPIGWAYAGVVWGYALIWFLLNDEIKMMAYRYIEKKKAKEVLYGKK